MEFVERSHSTDMQRGIVFDKATSEAFTLEGPLVYDYN